MSQTRAALDEKLSLLEARAHELSPKAYARRHLPEYWQEQVIGSTLTLIGVVMLWARLRRRSRQEELRRVLRTSSW
jgi:hypothetical protein